MSLELELANNIQLCNFKYRLNEVLLKPNNELIKDLHLLLELGPIYFYDYIMLLSLIFGYKNVKETVNNLQQPELSILLTNKIPQSKFSKYGNSKNGAKNLRKLDDILQLISLYYPMYVIDFIKNKSNETIRSNQNEYIKRYEKLKDDIILIGREVLMISPRK